MYCLICNTILYYYILYRCTILLCILDSLLYTKNNTIYMPKRGYYPGITLQFFLKNSKRKIIKKDITKNQLQECEEILLVGSGKGVVAVGDIPQINWYKKNNTVFNEFHRIYKSYINK